MAGQRVIWSVKQLIYHVSDTIDQNPKLKNVWVEGEISNFTHYPSGHMYFSLKDESTRVRCVMFSRYNRYILFHPQNGDRVMIRGEMEIYSRDGQIQLKALEMRKSGMGDLYQRYLQLKEKLERQGLFANKRPLPVHPRVIGVVTSQHGAAVRDIITTIGRRSPHVKILLFPVAVQGVSASREISYAIEQMNQLDEQIDLLIVGRGGGSLEELWAFNEEIVVRSIANSRIPVISAVGHETDTTLSDFAADLRAATPTAAAELAVPDSGGLKEQLERLTLRLQKTMQNAISFQRNRFRSLWDRPVFQQPDARMDSFHQRLDFLTDRLQRQQTNILKQQSYRLEQISERLRREHPVYYLQQLRDKMEKLELQLHKVTKQVLKEKDTRFSYAVAHLDALSPLKVMQRGYSLVTRFQSKQIVRSVHEVQPGDLLRIELQDGILKCQIWGAEEKKDE